MNQSDFLYQLYIIPEQVLLFNFIFEGYTSIWIGIVIATFVRNSPFFLPAFFFDQRKFGKIEYQGMVLFQVTYEIRICKLNSFALNCAQSLFLMGFRDAYEIKLLPDFLLLEFLQLFLLF